ncbi:MAG: nuclear transport factor 2 family protein [Sphingomonadaceae bacterium]|nr:nuclear transport factor 2 family protein [Sphingomonadaceae bacterium]
MALDEAALQTLLDKEAIRELALLYSRAIDRKDSALLRDLYTEDATDTHGTDFSGNVTDYVAFIESTAPFMTYSGHHVCNHLVSVDGDTAQGEVYVLAVHCLEAGDGNRVEDWHIVRYMDNYRRCSDGKWRFSKRFVTYDMIVARPFDGEGQLGLSPDQSYGELPGRLFAAGARG